MRESSWVGQVAVKVVFGGSWLLVACAQPAGREPLPDESPLGDERRDRGALQPEEEGADDSGAAERAGDGERTDLNGGDLSQGASGVMQANEQRPDAGEPRDAQNDGKGLADAGYDAPDAGSEACPFAGSVRYQLNDPTSWPDDARERIVTAMDEALHYYNCYASLEKIITVNYNPGVPTAEANVDGFLSFGSNPGYMVVATAMHEVAHTLGVGYFPWGELIVDGRWIGAEVNQLMANLPPEERDPDAFSQRDFITADQQHFWPYGLNQAAEHQSEWSLINNVRIVAAMQRDKQAYLSQ